MFRSLSILGFIVMTSWTLQAKVFISPPVDFKPKVAVAALFIENPQRQIFFIQRSKKSLQPLTWAIPGGKLENNETPLQAVVREIREEIGVRFHPGHLRFLKTVYIRYPKNFDYLYHMYYVKIQETPLFNLNKEEVVQYQWLDKQTVFKYFQQNKLIQDEWPCINEVFNPSNKNHFELKSSSR